MEELSPDFPRERMKFLLRAGLLCALGLAFARYGRPPLRLPDFPRPGIPSRPRPLKPEQLRALRAEMKAGVSGPETLAALSWAAGSGIKLPSPVLREMRQGIVGPATRVFFYSNNIGL